MKHIILLLIFCMSTLQLIAQTVIRGPYLQSGTSNSIVVRWRTNIATDSRVWYGTSPSNLTASAGMLGNRTDHEIQLNGLTPNQTYYYAVADGGGFLTSSGSDYSFVTAPPIGTEQPFKAWILGDCGTGHDDARAVRDAYYNYMGGDHTDAVLMLGDNAYREGTDAQYQNAVFQNMYEDILQKTVLWSCPGNHEYYTPGATPYYDIFTFPTAGEAGGLASGTEAYYSFDYGNIHFITLDSHNTPKDPGDPMLVWLQNDLNATSQDWIVVIFHHPPYSKGSHDSDNLNDSAGYMRDMRQNVLPILEASGVDLVLSGHSHAYERSYLIKGHYGFSNTLNNSMILDNGSGQINGSGAYNKTVTGATAGDGAVYITAGSSGKVTGGDLDHPVMYYSLNRLGSLSLEICDNQLDLKFINDYGVIDDYFSIVKDDYINQPPTVSITSHADSTYIPTTQTITLTADAFDPDGTIEKVEFCVGCETIGVDSIPPYSIEWTIPASKEYQLYAKAIDNDGNKVTDQIAIQVDTLCVCSIISNDNDDAEQNLSSNNVTTVNVDLELGYDSYYQTIGLRYTNLNIPQGAYIEGATVQFTADETVNNNPANFTIYGEDVDNAQPYTTANNNIGIRPTTTATVNWSPPNWTGVWDQGPAQETPDISTILQEIVDRPGYTVNSAIALMMNGTGRRIAESYNGEEEYAPKLCVQYRLCAPLNTPCDDGDATTINDVEDGNCLCKGESVEGCTDATACNYDATATVDDGSCNPVDCAGNCNGTETGNAIEGTACDDGDATTTNDVYDENCLCKGVVIMGCTDINACNYNASATVDNGTCNLPDCAGMCNGFITGPNVAGSSCDDGDATTINDTYDNDCICSGISIPGCMDMTACNYDANATVDNDSCNPVDCVGNCDGFNTGTAVTGTSCDDGDATTTNDVYDDNCLCQGVIIMGCTDINACNYNASATVDNGTCNLPDCSGMCNGFITGPNVAGSSCDDGDATTINDTYDNDCICSGISIPGCMDMTACNYDANATVDNDSCNPVDCTGNCDGFNTGTAVVGTSCDDGDATTTNDVYDENCLCKGVVIMGCTDINSCNYNALATVDNGTCNLPDCAGMCNGNITGPNVAGSSCDDGDATTINDTYDSDCNCMGTVIMGCMDANACNYNASATVDNGTCNLPDCLGNCMGMATGTAVTGTSCDDGDATTIDDIYNNNCECMGDCPAAGTPCDDNNNDTIDDEADGFCNCIGIEVCRPKVLKVEIRKK